MFVCPECGAAEGASGVCAADGHALLSNRDDSLLGTVLGPYQVASLLGVGGMGRVYKAVHPSIGSRVAIKVLSHDCAQRPVLVERFFAEARAVNLIRHENIVNVLDLSTLPDGRPYIIMEYLAGAPLSSVIASGVLPLGTTVQIAGEILAALGEAHTSSIVHRDLKPDNIFISPQGRAKVLDFGIAKLMSLPEGATGPTQVGSILGTPHYMSPEQACGQAIDARTDIYAMGIILYECVTGRPPFEGTSLFDLLRKHTDETPLPPSSLRPDLPKDYADVILMALAKNPEDRWQNAGAMRAALQSVSETLPPSAWGAVGTSAAPIRRPSRPSGSTPGATLTIGTKATGDSKQQNTHAAPTESAIRKRRSVPVLGIAAVTTIAGLGGYVLVDVVGASAKRQSDATTLSSIVATASTLDAGLAKDVEAIESDEPEPAKVEADAATPQAPVRKKNATQRNMRSPKTPTRQVPEPRDVPRDVPDAPRHNNTAPKRKTQMIATKRVDISARLSKAYKHAQVAYPDAKLVSINAQGVRSNGKADLTIGNQTLVSYIFFSAKAAEAAGDLQPLNTCLYYVTILPNITSEYPWMANCGQVRAVRRPQCTVKEIWDKAIEAGAKADKVAAQISYAGRQKPWTFQTSKFSARFSDDC